MASDDEIRNRLAELLCQLAGSADEKRDRKGADEFKKKIKALIAAEAGVDPTMIAVVLAGGGTQQARNRLSQSEPRKAPELTIWVLDPDDSIERSSDYVVDTIQGRRDATPPVGPLAFAAPLPEGGWEFGMVAGRPTRTSRLIARLFGVTPTDPRTTLVPTLPDGAVCWLLMLTTSNDYSNKEGVRYHFPTKIPNGQRVEPGDTVVMARSKTSGEPDAGHILGVGRVGRRINIGDGSSAYAYFDRYLKIKPPLLLDEVGDPRSPNLVNAIVKVDQLWVLTVMKALGVAEIDDLPTPITALSFEDLKSTVTDDGLIFSDALLAKVLTAVRSGKHIMLTGAPGTGKTSLALSVARAAERAALCDEALLTTGTADWTSADTVGAYRLGRDSQLKFHPGHVMTALEHDRWLIIDELNRADIDKAIGQLFTVLAGQPVTLPFEEYDEDTDTYMPISVVPPGQIPPAGTVMTQISPNWRIVATLNDRDRDLLFDMSEALMRRFAIISVPTLTPESWRDILARAGGSGQQEWNEGFAALIRSPALTARPLGAAILLDAVKHLREISHLHEEAETTPDLVSAFQEVLDIYVTPQLRAISESVVLRASDFMSPPNAGSPDESSQHDE